MLISLLTSNRNKNSEKKIYFWQKWLEKTTSYFLFEMFESVIYIQYATNSDLECLLYYKVTFLLAMKTSFFILSNIRGLSQKLVDFACNCFISYSKLQKCAYFQRIIYFLSNCEISKIYIIMFTLMKRTYI